MDEGAIIAASILAGAAIGRWWSVILAIPAGLLAGARFDFEGLSDTEVAVLTATAVAIGLFVGTAARKAVSALGRAR